jgi:hypothetical protein
MLSFSKGTLVKSTLAPSEISSLRRSRFARFVPHATSAFRFEQQKEDFLSLAKLDRTMIDGIQILP